MGRHHMIARKLQDGSLVEAFDVPAYESEIGYWLVQSDVPLSTAAACFTEWLIGACAHADA